MSEKVLQYLFFIVFFITPALASAWVARTKGRNWLGWLVICLFFPPTLVVCLFQGPKREVPGHYRRCSHCREYSKWSEKVCRFCQTELG